MNFRKLLTYLTMGTAAAMPIATAQNPTILQGSYISNVFGNSNFVLNPNAQTNTANVTVSNATVSRSTTTPLVATSEFTITTSTATGYADWALRTFDQGMKGQNCEARFTYRGFSVGTTTAQILQGTNVVAQLALTASTDPRIASINFPCGDLSAVTKFRLQQATASLTGTNEISGIYTGLATNMANVAQAETVAIVNNSTSTMVNGVSTKIVFTNEVLDVYDEYSTATGIFKAKRAGVYAIEAMTLLTGAGGWAQGEVTELSLLKNLAGFTSQRVERQAAGSYYVDGMIVGTISLAVGDEIQLNLFQNSGANINLEGGAARNIMTIKRFPSSSELVVTPERQNVFAAASWTGGATFNRNNTTEFTVSDGVFATNRTAFGKAEFTTTANDVAIKVPQMPPGTYRIEFAARQLVVQQASAGALDAWCTWYLKDGTNTASARSTLYGNQFTIDAVSSAVQIVKYTTLADRTFTASAQSGTTNSTACSLTEPKIIITPLDQPSNSALYVQGPVLGAQTGAAIPAGYVGEVKQSLITSLTNAAATTVLKELTNIELTPGVWLISASGSMYQNGATLTDDATICISTTSASCAGTSFGFNSVTAGRPINSSAGNSSATTVTYPVTVTATQRYYLNVVSYYSAGTPQWRAGIVATRLN